MKLFRAFLVALSVLTAAPVLATDTWTYTSSPPTSKLVDTTGTGVAPSSSANGFPLSALTTATAVKISYESTAPGDGGMIPFTACSLLGYAYTPEASSGAGMWIRSPDLDLTVKAISAQAWALQVVGTRDRIAYIPSGCGQPGIIWISGISGVIYFPTTTEVTVTPSTDPTPIQGVDGGYPVAVTGTMVITPPAKQAIEGVDGGFFVDVDFASHTEFSEGLVTCGTSTPSSIPGLTKQRSGIIQNQGTSYVRIGLAPTASFGARLAPGASTGDEGSPALKCISESSESSDVYWRGSR
jgi:hypothetical protein